MMITICNLQIFSQDQYCKLLLQIIFSVQILQIVFSDYFLQIVIPDFLLSVVKDFFAKSANCPSDNMFTHFEKCHPDHFLDLFFVAKFA